VCIVLCAVFRLIVVLFCVMCVICVLCLILVPLPTGKNPFSVNIIIIPDLSFHDKYCLNDGININ
jgi:hypothetical protein